MTWQALDTARRLTLILIASGASILAEGLFTVPGAQQAGIPFAGVFPYAWGAIAVFFSAASGAAAMRKELMIKGHRASTVLALVGVVLIGGAATGRAVAWALDSERGVWGSRSVWSIWLVMAGLAASVFVLAARLIAELDAKRQDDDL